MKLLLENWLGILEKISKMLSDQRENLIIDKYGKCMLVISSPRFWCELAQKSYKPSQAELKDLQAELNPSQAQLGCITTNNKCCNALD